LCTGDVEHSPINMLWNTGDHLARWRTQSLRPPFADLCMVATDPTGSNDHRLSAQAKLVGLFAVRWSTTSCIISSEYSSTHARDSPAGEHQLIHTVTKLETSHPRICRLTSLIRKRLGDTSAGTPRDVKSGNRVSMSLGGERAPFGPTHHRSELDSLFLKPPSLFPCSKFHIGMSPPVGPFIFRKFAFEPVPPGRSLPVLPSELEGVFDAQTTLHRGVDHKDPAERPECLTTKIGCILLLYDHNALPSPHQLVARNQARQSPTDDNDVSIHAVPLVVAVVTPLTLLGTTCAAKG